MPPLVQLEQQLSMLHALIDRQATHPTEIPNVEETKG